MNKRNRPSPKAARHAASPRAKKLRQAAKCLSPNRADSDTYFSVLFKHAKPGTFVSLRAFAQKAGAAKPIISSVKIKSRSLDSLLDGAFEAAVVASKDPIPRVFCPPVATFTRPDRAKEQDLANGLVLTAELDDEPSTALALLEKVLGQPTLLCRSGGYAKTKRGGSEPKLHAHWRLTEPTSTKATHALLKEARGLIIALCGADVTNVPIVHPLRPAGSVHRKGKPVLATIACVNADVEVDLKRAVKRLRRAVAKLKPNRAAPLAKKRKKAAATTRIEKSNLQSSVRSVLVGKDRHVSLSKMAMTFVNRGMSRADTITTLRELMEHSTAKRDDRWHQRLSDIPRAVDTAVEKLAAAESWRDPKPLPTVLTDVPKFDLTLLPDSLRSWVKDNAERMQVPAEMVAVPALVAAGAVLGRKVAMQPKAADSGWQVITNNWGCVSAEPSALKSPAATAGLALINELERQLGEQNAALLEEHNREKREYEVRKKFADRAAAARYKKDPNADISEFVLEPPIEPTLRRAVVVDSTQESLGKIHAANPNGLMVFRDELVPFLRLLDRDDRASDRAMFLSGHSGDTPHTYDRIGRGHISIPGLCLTLFGTTQPDLLSRYIKSNLSGGGAGDGMLQRFSMLVWPDATTYQEVDRPPDARALERARRAFWRLHTLVPADVKAVSGGRLPALKFSSRAQRLFRKWRRRFEARIASRSLSAILRTHLGKYRKLVPGLALLFHLLDDGVGPVPFLQLRRSIRLSRVFEAHAVRAYHAGQRADVDAAANLLTRIKKGQLSTPLKVRDIYRFGWRGLIEKRDVVAALEVLIDCNIVRRRGNGRGEYYEINPKLKVGAAKGNVAA